MKQVLFLLAFAAAGFAYTLADAERAYVSKDWKTALAAYGEVCKTLSGTEGVSCNYWYALALSQTGRAADFTAAGKKIDSLIAKVSPRDSMYVDLVVTRAQFEIYLKKYARARESLKHAAECSAGHSVTLLKQVCGVLAKADASKETGELCASLDSLARHPALTVPEASSSSAQVAQTAVSSSSAKLEVPAEAKPATEQKTPIPTAASLSSSIVSGSSSSTAQPAAEKAQEPREAYAVQIGAFGNKGNAENLVKAIEQRNIKVSIVERVSESGILYLVQTPHFGSRSEALEYAKATFEPLKVDYSVVKIN